MSVADKRNTLLDARDIARAIQRMAKQVVDFAGGTDRLVLVGIQRRGVDLARRLATHIGDGDGTHGNDAPSTTARCDRSALISMTASVLKSCSA